MSAQWQRQILEASGYMELGMLDEAAKALEEITPEDKSRKEVSGIRLDLYMAAKKWHLAATMAKRLLETQPENAGVWVNLAYSLRRSESLQEAEAVLLRGQALHPNHALIAYNLACYASVGGRVEEAKGRLRDAFKLDRSIRAMALEDPDLRPLRDWIARLKAAD